MQKITDISQLDLTKQYTYADYLTWWFDERVELIKGYIKKMAPAPLDKHQRVSVNLSLEIGNYLKHKICQVRVAPYDVRLTRSKNDQQITTVVQPDLCVICHPEYIDDRGCNGPPDMIVEILSLQNSKHDIKIKFELYQEAGVKEYWIVSPYEKVIDIFVLQNNKYVLVNKYAEDDKVPVHTLPGLEIDLTEVFDY